MSDLQCPATIVLLTPDLAATSDMREQRLSLVLLGSAGGAAESAAKRLAAVHTCQLEVRASVDGAALAALIAELSDSYRGEQVAIVASEPALRDALRLRAAPTAPIALAVDSGGWTVLSWETPQ